MTPSPNFFHQSFIGKLYRAIDNFLEEKKLGIVLSVPFDVLLSPRDVVEPDLLFVSNSRIGRITDKNVDGAPDLVVEVISESTRRTDKKIKLHLYESSDVIEYWLADPVVQTVEVYSRSQEGRLVRTAEYEDTDALISDLFSGLVINLTVLWVDRRQKP